MEVAAYEASRNFTHGGAEFIDPSSARPRAFYAGMRVTFRGSEQE